MKYLTRSLAASAFVALVLPLALAGCEKTPKTSETAVTSAPVSLVTAPQLWNSHWQFFRSNDALSLEKASQHNSWETISLPHTAHLEPRVVNNQWQGDAWYKKTFSAAPQWQGKNVFLDFEAAMNVSEVWINGTPVNKHYGGYLPFSILLTPHLKDGDNTLMVRLDNRDSDITGPKPLKILDFNMYGGIYRNTWLRVENELHISDPVAAGKKASGGIFVRYPQVTTEQAIVTVQTHIVNSGTAASVVVRHQLQHNGQLVQTTEKPLDISAQSDAEVNQELHVKTPQLWSPSTPSLYTLKTQILKDGQLVDEDSTRIGIRKFEIVEDQLYINGEKTFLRGVNRHQEYPYAGYALSDAAQYRDAEKMKAAGFDYIRLSHYPHAKAFMRAADELGLVLLDAILGWQYVNDTPAFYAHAEQTCRDLIRRDRNHASVLAWECSLNESNMPDTLITGLHKIVHEEYPSATTYSAGWVPQTYDIYLQARQHRLGHYKEPGKPYVVSEYGDWEYYAMNAGLNQNAWGELLQDERSSRQLLNAGETRLQQQAANIMEAHNDNFNTPAFADGYWVMFDYNRGYSDDLESSGIMSLERLPKFSYYFYQSQRDADDFGGPLANGYMAHIGSYWQADSSLNFHVYSNADEVELFLNGRSLGKGKRDVERYGKVNHPPVLFQLDTFEPGTLVAKAMADGKVVASHTVATPGEPAQLSLVMEATSIAPQTGQNDLVFVYAQLLDAKGNPTRVNGAKVNFSISGDAELVSPAERESEAGIAAALVKIGDTLESVRIEASYNALTAETLTFK